MMLVLQSMMLTMKCGWLPSEMSMSEWVQCCCTVRWALLPLSCATWRKLRRSTCTESICTPCLWVARALSQSVCVMFSSLCLLNINSTVALPVWYKHDIMRSKWLFQLRFVQRSITTKLEAFDMWIFTIRDWPRLITVACVKSTGTINGRRW